VNLEIEKYLALLEQRLSLLRALAQQLVGCRKEFVAMDLDGMYGRIGEQEELCRQIQSLHPAINSLQRTCARHLDIAWLDAARQPEGAAWAERLRGVMRELGEAQAEVGRLNQIHAAFLRRSRRTITMLMNFLGNYAVTYGPPADSTVLPPHAGERG
jgi:hypothetical protein